MPRLRSRRKTAAEWTAENPVLWEGEFGWDQTNGVLKLGDGVTPWNSLEPAFAATYAPQAVTNGGQIDGSGVVFGTQGVEWVWDGAVGDVLELIDLQIHNTGVEGSAFGAIHIGVDADAVDTAYGLGIHNIGEADALYIGVQGKDDQASVPTGIGIDLNRTVGADTEGHAANSGRAIQVWDWSSTDQGSTGPHALYLRKHANANSGHRLAYLYGNRDLLHMETPEGAGYNGSQPVMSLATGGTVKFQMTASGDFVFGNAHGFYFNMTAGNQGYMLGAGTQLAFRMGQDGLLVYTNGGTLVMGFTGGGFLRWHEAGLEATTVGAAGGASAPPATPTKYLKVVDSAGAILQVPAYAVA